MNNLEKIYEDHHRINREEGFSILEQERGELLRGAIGEGKIVLDLGCRDGALTKYFSKNNRVLGVDVDKNALNKAEQALNIETMAVDLNGDWNFKNPKFDIIVAGEVLEHLYHPEVVIEKIKKHLNAKGLFLGSVPNAFNLKNRLRYLLGRKKGTPLEDPTHINHFGHKELKRILQKHFEEVEIIGLGRFKLISRLMPNWFAFGLFFKAKLR